MKITALLTLVFILVGCDKKPAEAVKPSILVTESTQTFPKGAYNDLEVTYKAKAAICDITWNVLRAADKTKEKNVFLAIRGSASGCPLSFEQVRPTHQAILTEILNDFPKNTISGVFTGGLHQIDGSGEWSAIIADGSLSMPEWLEYRKSYPNHKSLLSTNDMMVMLMKKHVPHAAFTKLLRDNGIEIDIVGVEKVFTPKISEYSFKGKLKNNKPNERVISDAGSMWWSVPSELTSKQ